jgi:hypothetical protein
MTRTQLNRFIKKINYGKSIQLVYYSGKGRSHWNSFVGYAEWKIGLFKKIHINKKVWAKLNNMDKKLFLAHEVGHFRTNFYNSKLLHVAEYGAQRWAIYRLRELGMIKISKNLRDEMEVLWKNNKFTRYRLAYKLAKKKNLIS